MVRRKKSTGRWNPSRQLRDTYNYELKDGKKIVYRGITSNPKRRVYEHKITGKKFTHVIISRYPVSSKTAKKREGLKIKNKKRI